jgi:hypothetical protein
MVYVAYCPLIKELFSINVEFFFIFFCPRKKKKPLLNSCNGVCGIGRRARSS